LVAGDAPGQGTPARAYPDKTLRLIVPFPPGGGNDIIARVVGQRLSEVTGSWSWSTSRRAGGVIGATLAATAAPDGYTLFLGSLGNLAINPALKDDLPYQPRAISRRVHALHLCLILLVHPSWLRNPS